MAPPPKLTLAEWADRFRRLSPEASAEPGVWRTDRAEYQRGIMDAVTTPGVERVVVMSSAQVGKTEIVNNVVGYHVHQDAAPMLIVMPSLEMAEAWSKDRLAPMVRDSPALRGRIADPRSRDSGNTILHKRFAGGHLTIVGANAASGLASRPIRVALLDEVDRYPVSAGSEGDPVNLAVKRTNTFWNRRIVMTSTPTVKGESRIEAAFLESDQRHFMVPCPHCEEPQRLVWSQVRWPEGEPQEAAYVCVECGALWSDAERWKAISQGVWQATQTFRGVAGFHLSELYSPWRTLRQVVTEFLSAKGSPQTLQVFVNTSLGETWEERGEAVEAGLLDELREVYGPDDLPEAVEFATAGVDVQGDRLEVEVVGWGEQEESWGIEFVVLHGDPAQEDVWQQLDEVLLRSYTTETGATVRIAAACVDTGGHHAEAVLRFCRERARRRVFATKGMGGQGRPIWPLRASKAKNRDRVFMVGVDTAKDAVYARWQITEPGPGACHLPADPATGYDAEWCRQAVSEQRQTRYRHGRPYVVWTLPAGKRNEALDCRVYATAAMKAVPKAARRRQGVAEAPQKKKPAQRQGGSDWLGIKGDWL